MMQYLCQKESNDNQLPPTQKNTSWKFGIRFFVKLCGELLISNKIKKLNNSYLDTVDDW